MLSRRDRLRARAAPGAPTRRARARPRARALVPAFERSASNAHYDTPRVRSSTHVRAHDDARRARTRARRGETIRPDRVEEPDAEPNPDSVGRVAGGRYPRPRWTRATRSTRSRPTPSSPAGSCIARSCRRAPARFADLAHAAARRGRRTASRRGASTGSTRTRPTRSTGCARARASSIATGTASGKSLCYQVPIVESVVADRRDTALLDLPHQGARPRPAARRCARGSCPACARSPSTATPTPTTARGRARTPTSCSRIPTCCTSGSCRRTSAGRRS